VAEQPTGSVTLLFTDIEGSTRLLDELGAAAYRDALSKHRRLLRESFERYGGYEVDYEGDAFFVAFADAGAAVAAAQDGQAALSGGSIRVRMGLHTGEPLLDPPKYVGVDVHLAARIMAAAHGGQVVVSRAAVEHAGGAASWTDLGEHRLKDFAEPVWLYQLGEGAWPPLRTISNTNLPRPASSFVGREREVAEIVSLLREGARLVTLSGPGGSGKTRLALEAAAELVPAIRNGVFWIGLASLRDPRLVLDAVSQALGANDGLTAHIGERELLLVLDNLEQVIDAAPELATLPDKCPNLRLLVTSRELLRVRGEVEYAVAPLSATDALELFVRRSGVEADDTVVELCARLDNLPLAVELAASRTAVLSPRQILDRLGQSLDLLRGGRDADARQRTLRATIGWSYELLTADERALFTRLAIFEGGCTLAAAEEVAGADLDTLQSLVDKSLVRHTGERFWMLETIHEYASDALGDGMPLIGRAHALHYLALAERSNADEGGPGQAAAYERLEGDRPNLRAAFDWAVQQRDDDVLLRLWLAVGQFWINRHHLREARLYVEPVLEAAARSDLPLRSRADLLRNAFWTYHRRGEDQAADELARERLAVATESGDRQLIGGALASLAEAAASRGDPRRAIELQTESATLAREDGDLHRLALALHNLAVLYERVDDWTAVARTGEEALAISRRLDDALGAAEMEQALAHALLHLGEIASADEHFRNALPILHENNDLRDLAFAVHGFARIATSQGKILRAATLSGAREAILEGTELVLPTQTLQLIERELQGLTARTTEPAIARAWADGREMTVDEAVAYSLETGDAS
jgi:predicted ATPase/class 3 adenylate cyclase